MSQTSYSLTTDEAVAGQLAYIGAPYTALTYVNPVDEIRFGTAVQKITGDENGIERVDEIGADIVGVALRDTTIPTDEATVENAYPADGPVAVLRRGQVRVIVDDDVTPDDDVYIRICDTLSVQTITFDGDFVTSNSIACSVNGTALTATAFNTDHNTTIAALAAKIEATSPVLTATTPGGGSRVITVTSSNADAVTFVITVTGGASQAVDTVAVTTAGVEGTDQGVFRADSDSNTAIAMSTARFLTSGSSGDYVILDVNI